MSVTVDFQPSGRYVEVEPGTTLLDAARMAGVDLTADCGGKGGCGRCRVRLSLEAPVSPPSGMETEEIGPADLSRGVRLACQVQVLGGTRVDVPPESLNAPQRAQVEGEERPVDVAPQVRTMDLVLQEPDRDDLRADWRRLADAVAEVGGSVSPCRELLVLRQLPDLLREHDWRVRIGLRGAEAICVAPPGTPMLGLAVDIGTTSLAAYLVDLTTGRTLAQLGEMNPQIAYGEDVMSRIAYTMEHEQGLDLLQSALVDRLNRMAENLCGRDYDRGQIVDAVVVGNTAMHHLFLGLPVRQLGLSPYVAAVSSALDVRANRLGLGLAPGALVHLLPNIAGFVGADHTSMLLATGAHKKTGVAISLDVGTNTEITLTAHGRLISCSAASGPAFEGAHIKDGMRAADGAIERLRVVDGRIEYQTIGHQAPVGLCGSGILDAVAQLKRAGILDRRAAMDLEHPLVRRGEKGLEVVIASADETRHGREVILTRKDISEVQLAKGAIRAGIEILLREAGLEAAAVDEFVIAGAFGSYIDVRSAVTIGMFPDIPLERFHQVGNAAGMGARMCLISAGLRVEAAALAERIEYLELTNRPDFTTFFAQSMTI
ncbi:MAG: DUF4445 domain-containing protein [Proteobacteria bacterium]|nr:DUF4445 domain-containing protein [Pseudomonadota bacterium]